MWKLDEYYFNDETIELSVYREGEEDDFVEKRADFAEWLDNNYYLEGEREICTGPDHTGEPTYFVDKWSYTIDEILENKAHWNTYELLEEFLNSKYK